MLRYEARTHPGRHRGVGQGARVPIHPHSNQDAILVRDRVHQRPWHGQGELDESAPFLVAVADGVGTSPSPAAASRAVLAALREAFQREPHRPARHLVAQVHERICAAVTRAQRGMASTLAAVIVRGSRAVVFNSGDSRIYQLAAGQARLLSRDHTILQGMLDRGEISATEAAGAASFYSSIDACFIADRFSEPPEVFVREIDWEPGTTLLLCSDGLTGVVDAAQIAATEEAPGPRVEALFQAALERESEDDISLVMLTKIA